jgi:hypothetical protein
MYRRIRRWIRTHREGQVLALVAVMLVALLASMAMAIDLGMAYTARSEAQRVADAAALAGASVFLESGATSAAAEDRARDWAAKNVVRNRPVQREDDVEVQVIFEESKVRVWIRRDGLPAWFSRILGRQELAVSAMAAARVTTAGVTECVMPWAVTDAYLRNDNHPDYDPNDRRTWVPEPGEVFDAQRHDYRRAVVECDEINTGFGSDTYRDQLLAETNLDYRPSERRCDYGLPFVLRQNDPREATVPGNFMSIRLGESSGANEYQQNIESCNHTPIAIGDTLFPETGAMVQHTAWGVNNLIGNDETMWMDPAAPFAGDGGPDGGAGWQSPRFVTVALVAPFGHDDGINQPGQRPIVVKNFGRFFIEGVQGGPNPTNKYIQGRFLYYVGGTAQGEIHSPMVKTLRLVE